MSKTIEPKMAAAARLDNGATGADAGAADGTDWADTVLDPSVKVDVSSECGGAFRF